MQEPDDIALMQEYVQHDSEEAFAGLAARYSGIPKPSTVFVFLDENETTINDGIFALFRDADSGWGDAPSDRHGQGINLSFADGHCEHWRWCAAEQMTGAGEPAASGDDLQDLRRLQSALPGGLIQP